MPASAFEIGQFSLASSAIFWNSSSVMPGDLRAHQQVAARDALAGLERDGCRDLQALGCVTRLGRGASENAIEKQAEWLAAEQLFGVGVSDDAVGAGLPGDGELRRIGGVEGGRA